MTGDALGLAAVTVTRSGLPAEAGTEVRGSAAALPNRWIPARSVAAGTRFSRWAGCCGRGRWRRRRFCWRRSVGRRLAGGGAGPRTARFRRPRTPNGLGGLALMEPPGFGPGASRRCFGVTKPARPSWDHQRGRQSGCDSWADRGRDEPLVLVAGAAQTQPADGLSRLVGPGLAGGTARPRNRSPGQPGGTITRRPARPRAIPESRRARVSWSLTGC